MDCSPVSWWISLGLNVIPWALIGYWCIKVRRIRRLERETDAMRARIDQNLARSDQLLAALDQFTPWTGLLDAQTGRRPQERGH
jgi:hypothetical protein